MGLGGTENVILQLCEIMKEDYNIVVCSSGGVNENKLDTMGIKHYLISDIENKNIKNIIKNIKILKDIIQNEKIDIVHTHHRMASFYTSVLKYKYNFKFFITVHNTFNDKKKLTKFSYNGAKIIAVGEQVKKNLIESYRIDKENITVIKNAVKPFTDNTVIVEILKEYKNKGYFLVGNIGRLSEQKGMKYFIESIPIVLKENDNVIFLIVGTGEDRKELENIVKKNGLDSNVIFLGYRKDIQNIMSQIDLVVLSSLWEGLPLTPIEAFSVKKTIVATAVDGTIEIVKNGYNGITVKCKDSLELGTAISKLLSDKQLRQKYEENALKTFNSEFSFETLTKKYKKFYGENLEVN